MTTSSGVAVEAERVKWLVLLVHGTRFNERPAAPPTAEDWWSHEGKFAIEVRAALHADSVDVKSEYWSGTNSESERRAQGRLFRETLKRAEDCYDRIVIVAHSHGGSVVWEALSRGRRLKAIHRVVTVGTPYMRYTATWPPLLVLLLAALAAATIPLSSWYPAASEAILEAGRPYLNIGWLTQRLELAFDNLLVPQLILTTIALLVAIGLAFWLAWELTHGVAAAVVPRVKLALARWRERRAVRWYGDAMVCLSHPEDEAIGALRAIIAPRRRDLFTIRKGSLAFRLLAQPYNWLIAPAINVLVARRVRHQLQGADVAGHVLCDVWRAPHHKLAVLLPDDVNANLVDSVDTGVARQIGHMRRAMHSRLQQREGRVIEDVWAAVKGMPLLHTAYFASDEVRRVVLTCVTGDKMPTLRLAASNTASVLQNKAARRRRENEWRATGWGHFVVAASVTLIIIGCVAVIGGATSRFATDKLIADSLAGPVAFDLASDDELVKWFRYAIANNRLDVCMLKVDGIADRVRRARLRGVLYAAVYDGDAVEWACAGVERDLLVIPQVNSLPRLDAVIDRDLVQAFAKGIEMAETTPGSKLARLYACIVADDQAGLRALVPTMDSGAADLTDDVRRTREQPYLERGLAFALGRYGKGNYDALRKFLLERYNRMGAGPELFAQYELLVQSGLAGCLYRQPPAEQAATIERFLGAIDTALAGGLDPGENTQLTPQVFQLCSIATCFGQLAVADPNPTLTSLAARVAGLVNRLTSRIAASSGSSELQARLLAYLAEAYVACSLNLQFDLAHTMLDHAATKAQSVSRSPWAGDVLSRCALIGAVAQVRAEKLLEWMRGSTDDPVERNVRIADLEVVLRTLSRGNAAHRWTVARCYDNFRRMGRERIEALCCETSLSSECTSALVAHAQLLMTAVTEGRDRSASRLALVRFAWTRGDRRLALQHLGYCDLEHQSQFYTGLLQ